MIRYAIQAFNCFRGKHAIECQQEVWMPEGVIKHTHECAHCPFTKNLPDSPVPADVYGMLSEYFAPDPEKNTNPAYSAYIN